MQNPLSSLTPAQLKKYGIYAVLSFFVGLSTFLLRDDLDVRNGDLRYSRQKQEQLQQVLFDQIRLQEQQRNLFRDSTLKGK